MSLARVLMSCLAAFAFLQCSEADEPSSPVGSSSSPTPATSTPPQPSEDVEAKREHIMEILDGLGDATNYYELVSLDAVPDSNSNIVVAAMHGGPTPILVTNSFEELHSNFEVAYIYQAQNFTNIFDIGSDSEPLTNRLLTRERCDEYALVGAAYAYHAIKHLKSEGKTVYIMAHSIGSFYFQRMASLLGNPADKALISGVKLDVIQDVLDALYEGYLAGGFDNAALVYDRETFYHATNAPPSQSDGSPPRVLWNAMRLVSSLFTPRYSTLLNRDNIGTNVMYVLALYDTQTGRSTARETNHLKSIGVDVCEVATGHGLESFLLGPDSDNPNRQGLAFFEAAAGAYECPELPNPVPPPDPVDPRRTNLIKAYKMLAELGPATNYYELIRSSSVPDSNSNIVVAAMHGGPAHELLTNTFMEIHDTYEVAYIYQAQNFEDIIDLGNDSQSLEDRLLTTEQADDYVLLGAAYAYHAITNFKEQGKTVYILAHSAGSLYLQRMISLFGNPADKTIISGSRTEVPSDVLQATHDGYLPGGFDPQALNYDKTTFWHATNAPESQSFGLATHETWNLLRIAASLMSPRYSMLLDPNNIGSNILYVHAHYDRQFGRMTDEEIERLESLGIQVCRIIDAHDLRLFFVGDDSDNPVLQAVLFFQSTDEEPYTCPEVPDPIPAPEDDDEEEEEEGE